VSCARPDLWEPRVSNHPWLPGISNPMHNERPDPGDRVRCQKYARRYLHEATWRFNRRDKMADMIFKLIDASTRCRTVTERMLRDIAPLNTETRR